MIVKENVYPVKIAGKGGKVLKESNLLKEREVLQIGHYDGDVTSMRGRSFVILDFGKEIRGSVRILTSHSGNVRVRVRAGESYSESCSKIGRKGACNDHTLRDVKVQLRNLSDNRFFTTGFRFVRIDLYGGKLELKCVIAETLIYENDIAYEYRGTDEKIKEIFNVAKRTIQLCCSGGLIWDGVKRDRLVWIGDMYPEIKAINALYGATEIAEQSIEFVRKSTTKGKWINGISTYSMWWVIILNEYEKETGRYEFAEGNLSYAKEIGALFLEKTDCNGNLVGRSKGFVDWPTNKSEDLQAGVRAICVIGAKSAIELIARHGGDCSVWETLLARFESKELKVVKAKQIIALKYCATGALEDSERKRLVEGGARGMSTFMSYFILKAVAELFDTATAVNMMKEYYGGMLSRGATTFWEDFDLEWLKGSSRIDEKPAFKEKDLHGDYGNYCYKGFRHSLCHGWSAGVISFIKEFIG